MDIGSASWLSLVAAVLECEPDEIAKRSAQDSFVALGGTSLLATELAAKAERELELSVSLGALLGSGPLDRVIAAAQPVEKSTISRAEPRDDFRELLPEQETLLLRDELYGGRISHLLFSAQLRGQLDQARLRAAIDAVVAEHESLRTVFGRRDGQLLRRVLAPKPQAVIEMDLQAPAGADPVELVHARLGAASEHWLNPLRRPPIAWFLTRTGTESHILTVLIHHALTDGYGMGLLWRALFTAYARESDRSRRVLPPLPDDVLLERKVALEASGALEDQLRRRIGQLAGVPTLLELPTDLTRPETLDPGGDRFLFGLDSDNVRACEELAQRYRVTRSTVLLAAWAVAIGRTSGQQRFIIGVPISGRSWAATAPKIALCAREVPVVCDIDDTADAGQFIASISASLAEAVQASDVPASRLVTALRCGGDVRHRPLMQVAFAAHDDLVPLRMDVEDLEVSFHEGHCGGAVFDATLFVQRWEPSRLALEYATSLLTAAEAARLAESFRAAIGQLARSGPVAMADVTGVSERELCRLRELGTGPECETNAGLWQLFARCAAQVPERTAIRAGDGATLSYGQLCAAAQAGSALLARVGVRAGDRVVVALPRSVSEIIGILAVLRLGAAYVAVDTHMPDEQLRVVLREAAAPVAITVPKEAGRFRAIGPDGAAVVTLPDAVPVCPHVPPEAHADPARAAYIAFTSGSTGAPKGVVVPHRAVVRLVRDRWNVPVSDQDRFLRLAPLAFDASTLEIFATLCNGACLEIFPAGPVSIGELADFISGRRVTIAWLTAGLFRLMADHQPDAFSRLRQVITGGDVVPADQVTRLLARYPRLTVSNGYGPTENTTFTTMSHFRHPGEVGSSVSIGRPYQGTRVHLLSASGQIVPRGAVAELYAAGDGVADGYLHLPEVTRCAFGTFMADSGERLYRTGDLVRWNSASELEFLGRSDHQVKIRGFRVELDAVRRVLAEHPAVRDAVVIATAADAASKRLLGAVVADDRRDLVAELRRHAHTRLPDYAVPSLWAVLTEIPITSNGKVDGRKLERHAKSSAAAPFASAASPTVGAVAVPSAGRGAEATKTTVERALAEVLDLGEVAPDVSFFEMGGDSLRMTLLHDRLRAAFPRKPLSLIELFRYPTLRVLSAYLDEMKESTS